MTDVRPKTLLRQSTKGNQINVRRDSIIEKTIELSYKCEKMSPCRNLTLEEKKYLLATRNGDMANVKRMIHKAYRFHTIDINCVDSLGRGALNLAIESENLEMVELLIVMGVEPKDALLHAINAEFVEAVEILLEYEEIVYKEGDKYSWEKVDWNTAVFTPDITPLILAAHKDNFEILKILLDRGATIPLPHQIGCGCSTCTHESSIDSLRHSMSRVNEYRALASPSLISLSSQDPILTTFKLSWELRNLARKEKECHKEYTELRRQCQQFAVDLLDQTRSSEELAVILNREKYPKCDNSGTDLVQLPLLHLAIKYKQKKFIAHPHVQQLLSKIWYDGLPGFRSKSLVSKCFDVSFIALLFPVYCISYILSPKSELGCTLRKPIIKFLVHVTSYLCFLGILILVSQRAEVQVIELLGTERMKENLREQMKKQRGNSPTFLEWQVFIYVIGYMKTQYLDIKREGFEKHLKTSIWNVVELIKHYFYLMVFILRLYAYCQETIEIRDDPKAAYIPRQDWDMFDPQLIAESLFAIANVLSASKLMYMFSVNSHLGPLQLSLGRMFIDIVKFFSIYVLILFSFACGLNQLLWYYTTLEREKCYHVPNGIADWENNSEACTKWRRFGNLFEAIQTLFWTGFGEIGLESFDLKGINSYTRFFGLLMFAAYLVLNVTVLLNLLIAMMSNSYSLIQGQADIEWKFARTKLWIECFEKITTLPSPFNILPTKKTYDRLKAYFRNSAESNNEQIDIMSENNLKKDTEGTFLEVMQALVWRYISSKHRQSDINTISEDHIQEIKSDISSLKYQLWDILKENGMQITTDSKKDKVLSKKLRAWERQLMKDFHVGMIAKDDNNLSDDECKISIDNTTSKSDDNINQKFKKIARQAAQTLPSNKWRKTIEDVYRQSQIGKCKTEDSLRKQMQLQTAIDNMKILKAESPTTPDGASKFQLPPSRPSLLNLMKNVNHDELLSSPNDSN